MTETFDYFETPLMPHVAPPPPRAWQLPDGLAPGDVRHEAVRGPLWPQEWTAVRRAVLEVVL